MEIAERLRSHRASRGSSSQDLSHFFFFFFGVSCHCGLNPVCIRRIKVFWEEDDRGRQSCDRFVLSL